MAVDEEHSFARKDVMPSWFANAIQEFLTGVETSVALTAKSATVLQIVPDPARGIAAIAIQGRWRWNETAIERAMSGSKATYTVWAVAEDNSVTNSPEPFTDHTVRTWDLRFTTGANPTGTGVVIFEKIGEVDWSGTAIEAIRQTHAQVNDEKLALIRGRVKGSDGSKVAGKGFTVTRSEAGSYLVKYTVAYAFQPVVIPICESTNLLGATAQVAGGVDQKKEVVIRTFINDTNVDVNFNFLVLGI